MADDSLSSALSGLSLQDLSVDADGKVRISNPDIARRITNLAGGPSGRALSDSLNTGTCHNTACIAPGIDQLARVSNPALR